MTFTEKDITYQFKAPGPQMLTLIVTDDQGMTSELQEDIYVTCDTSLSTADFFTIPTYPEAGDYVQFRQNNTVAFAEYGEIIERCTWQIDDINGENPEYFEDFVTEYQFEPAGDYNVTLTIWDYWAANEYTPPATITKTIHVGEVGSQPVADFSAERLSGIAPLYVQFYDESHGSIHSWDWNFGDSSPNSSGRFPGHDYTVPGTYPVSLTVTREDGTFTTTKENYIRVWTEFPVNESPVVDWDYEFPSMLLSRYPTPGETINFYDDSWDVEDEITDWDWDFGDGTTSPLQNPSHQYAASGTYFVNLTVTDSYGSRGWYGEEFIVNYPPSVSFTMDPAPPIEAGESVTFTGTVSDSDGSIPMSTWIVGGDEISEEFSAESPLTYTFYKPGLYAVGLRAIDDVNAERIVIWPVVVNDQAMTTYCMLVPGMTVADQQLAIFPNITSQYLVGDVVTIADEDVIVSMNGLTTTIHTDGLQDVDGYGILTGNVTSGTISSEPLVSDSLSLSPVQASFTANLAPDSFLGDFVSAAIITANLSETASTDVQSAYALAAVNASLDIVDVAYAFNIIGASMLNGIDVLTAEIVMTAPESWVETQGGPEYVRIFRYSEYDGTTEILTPAWSLDAGTYTFTALSPNGLSVFSLAGVQSANRPPVITIPGENEYQFLSTWGDQGTGDGQFNSPRMIDLDAARNVYVTDSSNNRIQKFDAEGRFVTGWGTAGSGEGQFNGPYGIVVDSEGFVYVADYFNHRVQKFDSNGAFVTTWGSYGDQPGQLNGPYGLALNRDGKISVAESGNFRVQTFDRDGTSLSTLSGVTTFPANFSVPRGIAFDDDDNLYVVAFHEVLKFDSDGDFITRWGGLGDAPGQLNNPVAIAIDSKGTIFVSEPDAHRISVFDTDGVYLSRFGSYGSEQGQFDNPNGINFDERDTLYVADGLNYRIQTFSPTLRFVIDEGEESAFSVLATDQDNDQITFEATGLPAGASFDAITGQFSWTPSDAGVYDGITFTVSDGELTDAKEVTITVKDVAKNNPPILDPIGEKEIDEGQLLQFTVSASDPDRDALTYHVENLPAGATFNDATFSWNPGFDQAGTYQDIKFVVTDGAAADSENITIVVADILWDDKAPLVGEVIASPNPAQLNTPIIVTTTIDDTDAGNSVVSSATCLVDGIPYPMSAADGAYDGSIEAATVTILPFNTAGVHSINITAIDAVGNTEISESILLAVYDPSAGFVTGGGWIMSPAGAYDPDPTLTGKATVGFVSKYQKGAKIPTGQTEFQFKAGNLNFKSTWYDWLVVAGAKAQYKGVGTINGAGEYGFMLTAIDGAIKGEGTDLFRIKIWDKATDALVYDNQIDAPDTDDPTMVIGGGSIVIHTK
jgi:PKD repeat protein